MEKERWKDIKGYEGLYQVSTLGRLKSYPKESNNRWGAYTMTSRILKPSTRDGYLIIVLYKNKSRKTFSVHRLVGQAFIPNPLAKPEINHKRNPKTNNNKNNLEWATKSENIIHSYKILKRKGSNLGGKKLIKHVTQISPSTGNKILSYRSIMEAERITKISRHHIGKCVTGKRKLAGGFIWMSK